MSAINQTIRPACFIYLTYGQASHYQQEMWYSYLSLAPFIIDTNITVYLYTDQPDRYRDTPFRVVDIRPFIDAWSKQRTYLHRLKIAVVQHALTELSDRVMFVDTDTIFYQDPCPLFERIDAQHAVLHAFEKADPFPAMSGFKHELPSGANYCYTQNSRMYNSGLIGVSSAHSHLMQQTLELIDALHVRFSQYHTLEQFGLSEILSLNKITITTCEDKVHHYWRSVLRKYMHAHFGSLFKDCDLYSSSPLTIKAQIPLSYLRAKWHALKGKLRSN